LNEFMGELHGHRGRQKAAAESSSAAACFVSVPHHGLREQTVKAIT
jgi:hypothetical protein